MTLIADLMTPAPLTVKATDVVGDVRDTILELGVHCLPVSDNDDHPIGIVTSWDLVEEYAPQESIQNAMTLRVQTIGAHQSPAEAANEMLTNAIHHLVVVDDQRRIVGVLSSLDLLTEVANPAP